MRELEMEAYVCHFKLYIGLIIEYEGGLFLYLSCCFTVWIF